MRHTLQIWAVLSAILVLQTTGVAAQNGVVTTTRIGEQGSGSEIWNVNIVDTKTGASRTLVSIPGANNTIAARALYNPVANTVEVQRVVNFSQPNQMNFVDTYDAATGNLLSTVNLASRDEFAGSTIYQLPPDLSPQVSKLGPATAPLSTP
jgi:hypothetical protein